MANVWAVVLLICLLGSPISMVTLLLRQRRATRPPERLPQPEELVQVGASEPVATLLATGRKIEAIIAYREAAGRVGLTEAKRAVDAFLIGARTRALQASGTSEHIASLVAQGQTTRAARAYRTQMGVSLREAKAIIEAMRVGDGTRDH
jgi:ribosomal protein L7/L12